MKRKFITDNCIICYDYININNKKNNIILKCGHNYHKHCIIEWFEYNIPNYLCPICKKKQNLKRIKIKINKKKIKEFSNNNTIINNRRNEYNHRIDIIHNEYATYITYHKCKYLILKFIIFILILILIILLIIKC